MATKIADDHKIIAEGLARLEREKQERINRPANLEDKMPAADCGNTTTATDYLGWAAVYRTPDRIWWWDYRLQDWVASEHAETSLRERERMEIYT